MDLIARCSRLEALCESLSDVDFTFLYDEQRDLFSIGYKCPMNSVLMQAILFSGYRHSLRITVCIARKNSCPRKAGSHLTVF